MPRSLVCKGRHSYNEHIHIYKHTKVCVQPKARYKTQHIPMTHDIRFHLSDDYNTKYICIYMYVCVDTLMICSFPN